MIAANTPDFRAALEGLELVDHPVQLKQRSRDFYWYSPILKRELDGKAADLIAVDLGKTHLRPCYDPVSHLVYACGREDVTHVWVGGTNVVSAQRPASALAAEVAGRVCLWHNKLVD